MKLDSVVVLLVVAAASLLACRREPELNVMGMEPLCDTVPPPVQPGEKLGAVVPVGVSAKPDSAVLVGTVSETITGRLVAGATVMLTRGKDSTSFASSVAVVNTNPSGGFVLSTLPGSYTITTRIIGRPPLYQRITLHAGMVATVRLEMRYRICHGY